MLTILRRQSFHLPANSFNSVTPGSPFLGRLRVKMHARHIRLPLGTHLVFRGRGVHLGLRAFPSASTPVKCLNFKKNLLENKTRATNSVR